MNKETDFNRETMLLKQIIIIFVRLFAKSLINSIQFFRQKYLLMKKEHILYTIAIFLFSFCLSCKKQESAKPDIGSRFEKDTIYRQTQEALYTDPLFARRILKEAMQVRPVQDSVNWYLLYNLYIKTYLITSEFDSVLLFCQKTEQFCSRQKELTPDHYYLLADVNNNLGNRYALASINDSAIYHFSKMLEYSKLTGNKRMQITACNNLADVKVHHGDYSQGAYYYRMALLLADSLHLPRQEMINTYTGLGQTYMELRDFDLSHYYYEQAYRFFDYMDLNHKFVYFTNHGNVYYFQEKYQEALALFRQGFALVRNSPEYAYAQNLCKLNMGEIFMLMGALDSAQYYLNQCYGYFKTINNQTALYHAETQKLELALKKKDIAAASGILNKEKLYSNTEPTLVSIRKKHLQHYYEEMHDYEKAYKYLKENMQMDDSIRNERIQMRVAEIDLRYKQDTTLMKQALFIQQQQSDLKSMEQNILIWILACILIFIIAIFLYFYQRKQRAYLQVKYRNQIVELRMENIRNRVSPHFIFNVLNRVLSRYKETDNEYQNLYNLIKIMRLNLQLTEKLSIPLEEELEFVRTYLGLEQQQIGTSLQIDIHIAPGIDTKQIQIPSMMIQIPSENAIKHGLRNKEGDKKLSISITKENEGTCICIEDNGPGFAIKHEANNPQSTSTGLKVLNHTIQLLNIYNPVPITMSIINRKNEKAEITGCSVKIVIPEQYKYALPEDK